MATRSPPPCSATACGRCRPPRYSADPRSSARWRSTRPSSRARPMTPGWSNVRGDGPSPSLLAAQPEDHDAARPAGRGAAARRGGVRAHEHHHPASATTATSSRAGRPLVLGGVRLEHSQGLLGHSDADVLTHAVIDALLGAAGLGDIGEHFPDTDPRYAGADSLELLAATVALLTAAGHTPRHVDVTVVIERPKLAPVRAEIRANLAAAARSRPGARERQGHARRGDGLHRPRGGRGGARHRHRRASTPERRPPEVGPRTIV